MFGLVGIITIINLPLLQIIIVIKSSCIIDFLIIAVNEIAKIIVVPAKTTFTLSLGSLNTLRMTGSLSFAGAINRHTWILASNQNSQSLSRAA